MSEQNEGELRSDGEEKSTPAAENPPSPRWRPASEPTCCGSGCDDCPF